MFEINEKGEVVDINGNVLGYVSKSGRTVVDENGKISTVETVVEIVHLYVNTEITSIMKLCDIYSFTELQCDVLDDLLSEESAIMWGGLLFAEKKRKRVIL